MDRPIEFSLNDYDPIVTPIEKNVFLNSFDNGGYNIIKYRNIPVNTFDGVKTPGVKYENASGVKEVKKVSSLIRNNPFHGIANSALDPNPLTTIAKKRSKLDTSISVNTLQRKLHSDHSFLDRQSSLSEPNLSMANDRGDNIALQDLCRTEIFLPKKYLPQDKSPLRVEKGVRGCIYIKKEGKVYKTNIDTRHLLIEENEISSNTSRKEKFPKNLRLGSSVSRSRVNDDVFGTNSFKISNEDIGDYEVAIFLSGFKKVPEKKHKKKNTLDSKNKQGGDYIRGIYHETKPKKKKRSVGRGDTPFGRSYESDHRQNYYVPPKTLKINQNEPRRSRYETRSTYRTNKSAGKQDFSSDELSDNGYVFNENEDEFERHPEKHSNASPEVFRGSAKSRTNEAQNSMLSYRSAKNEVGSYRSRPRSHSSISRYTDVYGSPKLKISDEELWDRFENIFRSYASTSRHSGEVIPRRISTEWMTNSGVVDEIMTDKEADDAFRNAAGAKITMNAQEYKEFIIMLTLRMKLPYYEIYRRMCGM